MFWKLICNANHFKHHFLMIYIIYNHTNIIYTEFKIWHFSTRRVHFSGTTEIIFFPIDLFKYLLNRCFWHLRTTHEIMLDTPVSRVSRWVLYKIQFWEIIEKSMKKARYRKVGFPASGFYFSGTTKTVSIMIWHTFLLNPRNKHMENYNAINS